MFIIDFNLLYDIIENIGNFLGNYLFLHVCLFNASLPKIIISHISDSAQCMTTKIVINQKLFSTPLSLFQVTTLVDHEKTKAQKN